MNSLVRRRRKLGRKQSTVLDTSPCLLPPKNTQGRVSFLLVLAGEKGQWVSLRGGALDTVVTGVRPALVAPPGRQVENLPVGWVGSSLPVLVVLRWRLCPGRLSVDLSIAGSLEERSSDLANHC